MSLKYCQGPDCHAYTTQDRLKGTKPNKTYQTRRRKSFYYGKENFCSQNCMYDWFNDFGDRAINHFGRTTEAKHLTEDNAWVKREHWSYERERNPNLPEFYYINRVTNEQRPLTEAQYNDQNYTLNTI